MNRKAYLGAAALLLVLHSAARAGENPGLEFFRFPEKEAVTAQDVRYAGTRPLFYGGLLDAMKAFTRKTGHRASAMAGGCGTGAKHLKNGKANLGGFCCPLTREEKERLGWVPIPVARDFIPVIVHPSNPVDNLSFSQLRGIFRGEITNWKEVGGPDKPIVLVIRNHCKNRRETFRTRVVGASGYPKRYFPTKTVMEEAERVARSPHAIGVLVGSHVVDMSRLKVLAIDGVYPSRENLVAGRYPLVREISLVIAPGTSSPAPREFVRFLLSPQGQAILQRKLLSKP